MLIWSILKFLVLVGVATGLTFGAIWLMDLQAGAQLVVGGLEFNLSPPVLAIGLVILLVVLWLVLKLLGLLSALLRFIAGDKTALSHYLSPNGGSKQSRALTDVTMALAAGEGEEAMAKLRKAERYLKHHELNTLLIAQAADLAGNRKKADETYRLLLSDDRTRVIGLRGLFRQTLAEGDTDTALKLAKRAALSGPAQAAADAALRRLQAGAPDTAAKGKAAGKKAKTAPPAAPPPRSEAAGILAAETTIEQREAAIEASRKLPEMIPATVLAAKNAIAAGKPEDATRLLQKAWSLQPDARLATAFAEIAPDEAPDLRLKRFEALTGVLPDDPETRMLQAELLLAAGEFVDARLALGDLAERAPTARNLTLMAAIAKGAGADAAIVRDWLTRALAVLRGPQQAG
ncbi:MAG: heme biosynthesis protein HemY [Rubellimicrobium sp.]|nr:heme biosynthesis protein HemY [Rubellimicrobium sp.]